LTLACAFVVPLNGQTDKAQRSVSVVGCLQRNDNSGTLDSTIPESTATPETAPKLANSGEPAPGFQLAGATPLKSSGKLAAPAVYVLNGSDAQLSKHLGHRVRITGVVIPNVASNAQVQGPVATQGTKQLKGDVTRIKVTKVTMVRASCSPGKASK
jgi:hypothetical protein